MKLVPHVLLVVASLTGAVPVASAMTFFEPLALFGGVRTTVTIESSPNNFALIDRAYTTKVGGFSDPRMVYELNDGVDWLTFTKDVDDNIYVTGISGTPPMNLPSGQIAFLYADDRGGWESDIRATKTSWSDLAYNVQFANGSLLAFNVAKAEPKSTPLPAAAPLLGIVLMGVVGLLHRRSRGRVVDQGPSQQLAT